MKDLQTKRALCSVLLVLLLSVAGMMKMQAQNITFADANVKAICVANWDTDGDGELNQAEAAEVTNLDGMFMFDDEITTFDELSFFTGLTSIGEDEFNSCTSLTAVSIPNEVTSIGNYAFSDCSSLTSLTSYACTPPTMGNNVFDNVPSAMVINVPCHTSAMYQAAEGWSDFSNYVEFEYGLCPIPFVDDNVKAICVAHWDTNGDGELSYAEAAAVTNLGTHFKSTAITSFDELEYFTSLTSVPNTAFYGCTGLASIALPSSVSALGNGSFYNCTNLATMTVYAETPPTVGTNAFKNVPTDIVVYLPCGTYDAYHNANGWNGFANIQEFGLCSIVFADAYVKALCVTNWDTNGDGELNYDEAAAVTDLGEVFRSNNTITSFNELQYFTGLTSIGNYAFYYCCNLTCIKIPNSVISIGSRAFYGCSLTSIEIPNSVTSIGVNSFACSSLEQIIVASDNAYYDSRGNCNAIINTSTNALVRGCKNTVIPNGVTSIGNYAFCNCRGLTAIEIPNSVTLIGDYAFYDCDNLTSIELPNSVTSIGQEAFAWIYGLISIELPNSVTSIGSFAFSHCTGLTTIEIPNSVTSIQSNPFWGCSSLTQIIVDSGNIVYDSRNNCNAIIKTSTNLLVTGCKNTIIPNSVTSIGYSAFDQCFGLTFIEIPNSVTSIGTYAFKDCRGLTSIEIPNSVTSIGYQAFYNSGLTSLTIGNSVNSIGSYAFSYCEGLRSITVLAETPPTLSDSFNNVSHIIPVYVPCNAVETYQTASGWSDFTDLIGLCSGEVAVTVNPSDGGTVTGAGSYSGGDICVLTATPNPGFAFENWMENGIVISADSVYSFYAHPTTIAANFSSNSSIVFADADVKALCVANWDTNDDGELSYIEAAAVTDLGEVFSYNSLITSFNELQHFINLTSIGDAAFYGCSSLTSIELPNSVTTIGNAAFMECSGLTSIELPNSVTSIYFGAFFGCSGLTSIVIPNSVTSIGQQVFSYCIGIEQITVASDNTIYDSRGNCNAIIRTSTNELITGCKNTIIPNSVSFIRDYAFNGCIGLTSIVIPNSVTGIEGQPFRDCGGLEQIVVDSGNPAYDSRENCNAIIRTSTNTLVTGCKNTVIPNTVTSIGDLAFYGCSGFTGSLIIPNSVTSIGYDAFMYCSGFTGDLIIPNSVFSIGSRAFYNCSGFTGSLTIGNSVTTIGEQAFCYCSGFTGSLTIPNSVISIGDHAFFDCFGFTGTLTLGNSLETIGVAAFGGGIFLSDGLNFTGSLTIPNSITTIGQAAFAGCSGLTSINVLPETPPTLGNSVFYGINSPVYVPCESVEAYMTVNWGGFSNFIGMCAGEITATANPLEGGTIIGAGYYEGGATCTLTATANTGYAFINWTKEGEVVSDSEIYNFYVAGDASFVANFIAIPPVPVIAEYYPDSNEPNSPYVKVQWAASSFEIQIGEGTLTFGYFPFYTLYNYSIAENLFLASELEEAGVTSSPMTSLSWYATNAPGYAQQGISIWMANVSDAELTTTSHTVNNMTLVYTGAMTPEIGWNEFVFNEGTFTWDGESNVLIFCQRNNGEWNSTVWWQSDDVGFTASSYRYQDSGPYNVNVANTMTTSTKRPNIIMKGSGSMTYNLYRANCDGTGVQQIAENLSEAQYIDETWWQLENDSYKYGVSIADSTNTEIFWSNCIEKQGNIIVQTTTLSQGWNWFSTYIAGDDILNQLEAALGTNGMSINTQGAVLVYRNGMWMGGLNSIENTKGYKIRTNAPVEVTIAGQIVDPANCPITITQGANWIGYPLPVSQTVGNALAGFTPSNGDVIMTQGGTTVYRAGQWMPVTFTFEPGKAYIYKSTSSLPKTLIFSNGK